MDRHDLYERCVQNPPLLAAFLARVHAGDPLVLHEDFCGSAALCRHWVSSDPGRSAVGVDSDAPTIRAALDRVAHLGPSAHARIHLCHADATAPLPPNPHSTAILDPDIIYVGNFSLGELQERAALLAYLRRARARLAPGAIFVADTFGGAGSFRAAAQRRVIVPDQTPDAAPPLRVHCTWQQGAAGPFSARIRCALHFRVEVAGEIILELTDAFVYHWRLWSVPELADALLDAGFTATDVYTDLEAPPINPAAASPAHADAFTACIVART